MRKRKPNPLALEQRLGVTVDNSAATLDCGRSKIYDLVRKGKLKLVDIDGMSRITADSLRKLVAAQKKVVTK